MTSTLITAYLGKGLASARPAAPVVAVGCVALYWATDTDVLSAYDGSWHTVVGGLSPGTPPTIVQSKIGFVTSGTGLTLSSAPVNGNLLIAMFFNPTVGGVGAGWISLATNSTGADFGTVAYKVAGAGESTTQNPVSSSATGMIMIWELNGQNATINNAILNAQSQAEQAAGLFSSAPSTPNVKNAITLMGTSLVSTSNNINTVSNMTQDQVVNTGTTRQGVMGHSTADTPVGQPIVTFTGSGTPSNKSCVVTIST